jgi:uncharacterized membrane protein (DUF373 family)
MVRATTVTRIGFLSGIEVGQSRKMSTDGRSGWQRRWRTVTDHCPSLTFYQRFESIVALALTLVVSLVILVALYRLIAEVITGLVVGVLDPLDHTIFQAVFGQIITLLIALEFNHTLQYVVTRVQSIIQIKVVLLIALLALARKFIILDLSATTPTELLSLAAATLALGITYGLIQERDNDRGRA